MGLLLERVMGAHVAILKGCGVHSRHGGVKCTATRSTHAMATHDAPYKFYTKAYRNLLMAN
jgi:hypothetical protein